MNIGVDIIANVRLKIVQVAVIVRVRVKVEAYPGLAESDGGAGRQENFYCLYFI